jgi:hypothetical protein
VKDIRSKPKFRKFVRETGNDAKKKKTSHLIKDLHVMEEKRIRPGVIRRRVVRPVSSDD